MTDRLLEMRNVTVGYRQPGLGFVTAVDDVSLELGGGEVLGLVGESGCGKSTLARSICGLEPLRTGTITFKGIPVNRLSLRRRPKPLVAIQMVFQNPYASLNPRRTVGSQILDGVRASVRPVRWTVAELLSEVELDAADALKYPHEFSGGQRQRIAIARAVAASPDLLIGDEAIASLDASLQAKIARLMKRLAVESGAALLFISHDLAVVRVIADDVAVMRKGVIVEHGPVSQVWDSPTHDYTKRLLAAIPVVDGLGTMPGTAA